MRPVPRHGIIPVELSNEHAEHALDGLPFVLRVKEQLLHNHVDDEDIYATVHISQGSGKVAVNRTGHTGPAGEEDCLVVVRQRPSLRSFRKMLPREVQNVQSSLEYRKDVLRTPGRLLLSNSIVLAANGAAKLAKH